MIRKISRVVLTTVLILLTVVFGLFALYVLLIFGGGLISNYINDVPDEAMPREGYLFLAVFSVIVAFVFGLLSWRLAQRARRQF